MINSIKIKDLKFSYKKNEVILDIPILVINKNEKVFIHGPSGSGKSTLLNLMAGVLTPTLGEVTILGKNLALMSQSEKDKMRGDHIGFIFQNFNLISYLTIYENILLPLKSSKLRTSQLDRNISEEISRLAENLKIKDYLHKRITQLSVGQQQRVAVARALIGGPEIVIADEPTSSLDEDVTDSFMQLLLEEYKKKKFSLIFVSHDKRLSKYFERKIFISEISEEK